MKETKGTQLEEGRVASTHKKTDPLVGEADDGISWVSPL